MKKTILIATVVATLMGTGCAVRNVSTNGATDAAKNAADTVKETTDELKTQAVETKDRIDEKLAQAEQVADGIVNLQKSIEELFGNSDVTIQDIDLCETADDCAIVDYDGCCTKNKAINKQFVDQYYTIPQLQKDEINCAIVSCSTPPEIDSVTCEADAKQIKRCVLIPK
jgi:hypothetical protein